MPETEAQRIFPALRCRDADAMIRFLTEALGFSTHVAYRGEDGMVHHAQLAFGGSMIMLGQEREDDWSRTKGAAGRPGSFTTYVVTEAPDTLHDRAKAAGAEIAMPLTDQPYGSRDFAVRDPEGNVWSFGTYWPKVWEPPLPG
jgi:uncharacterized glyoxalase superfamily protein PhnB